MNQKFTSILNHAVLYLQSLAAKPQSALVDAVTDLSLFAKEVKAHQRHLL